jgi:hypothetical protein
MLEWIDYTFIHLFVLDCSVSEDQWLKLDWFLGSLLVYSLTDGGSLLFFNKYN